jgi:hypothetical protein
MRNSTRTLLASVGHKPAHGKRPNPSVIAVTENAIAAR